MDGEEKVESWYIVKGRQEIERECPMEEIRRARNKEVMDYTIQTAQQRIERRKKHKI